MPELSLADIRTDYKKAALHEAEVASDPLTQFNKWFSDVMHSKLTEPNAMTLATVGRDLKPAARIVLLKEVDEAGFYFYTNYESRKGQTLSENPHAALVFFWKELERQVRIEGTVTRARKDQSDTYFHSRPEGSQLGAWTSPQSQIIPNRAFLEQKLEAVKKEFEHKEVVRPDFWGGYVLYPKRVEFWQGRASRLHDRIQYTLADATEEWKIERLAP